MFSKLLNLANIQLITQTSAYTLTGNLETLLWPQLRSDVSNRLVSTGAHQPTTRFTAVEEAYRHVFSSIPESGNCWCHSDKRSAPKGPAQDKFDQACKSFHDCMTAGYLSDLSAFNSELNVTLNVPTETYETVTDQRLLNMFVEDAPINFDNSTSTAPEVRDSFQI